MQALPNARLPPLPTPLLPPFSKLPALHLHHGGRLLQPGPATCSPTAGTLLRQPGMPSHVCQASRSAGRAKKGKKPKAPISEAEMLRRQNKCCYGCGSVLQCEDPRGAGHVAPAKYAIKKMHRQLNQVLCDRCSELSNGAMIPGVQDFVVKQQQLLLQQGQQQQQQQQQQQNLLHQDDAIELLGKSLVTPEQLRQQLMEVRSKKAVVVMLVDLMDVSGTLMGKVRDMVGPNPIILVGTKMDLLPEKAHPRDVAEWLMDAAMRKKLNVISCHLVSSRTGEGVSAATSKVCAERKGRDVYVVGAANVGKSAFVRAMLKDMSLFEGGNFDPAARATGRYLPVESPMPGTTLGIIPLQAFVSGGTLYDTPGVHLHHRVPHMLSPEQLRLLHPRKRLTAILPPMPRELTGAEAEQAGDPKTAAAKGGPAVASGTYLWGDLVRIDVLAAPSSSWLAFYSPSTLRVRAQPLAKEEASNQLDQSPPTTTTDTSDTPSEQPSSSSSSSGSRGSSPTPSSSRADSRALWCADSVRARGGLVPHTLVVRADGGGRGALADVAVSGVPGWVTIFAPGARRDVRLCVWAPKGVEVFLRPALPAGPPPQPAGQQQQEDEGMELDEQALAALASEYGDGESADPFNDPAWWEAAVAELQGFESMQQAVAGGDSGISVEEDEEGQGVGSATSPARLRDGLSAIDEAEGWVTLSTDGKRRAQGGAGSRGGGGGGGRGAGGQVVVSGSVEEAMRRAHLDAAFGQWGVGDDEEEERPPQSQTAGRASSSSSSSSSRSRLKQRKGSSFRGSEDEGEGFGSNGDDDSEDDDEAEEGASESRPAPRLRRRVPLKSSGLRGSGVQRRMRTGLPRSKP